MKRSPSNPAVIVMLAVSLAAACIACNKDDTGRFVQSSLPRITNPQASEADRSLQTNGNNAFAFDCYRQLAAQQANVFYSPLSVSIALAMAWAGARNATERQMAEALDFELPQDRLHPFFNALDLELVSRGKGSKAKDGSGFRLRIANALWGQEGYEFLPAFLDTLAQHYGAGMRLLDFNDTKKAAEAINRWIADATEDRITDLVSEDALRNAIGLVLTNAVYFNAAWEKPFEKSATHDGEFTQLNGQKIRVPMMRISDESFRVGSGALARCGESSRCGPGWGYQAIELPYDGEQLSMLIIMPDQLSLDNLETIISPDTLATIVGSLKSQLVALTMPRWTFRSPVISLKSILQQQGMADAFNPDVADFSGMDGSRRLFIDNVLHQAFVAVDEAGTEAAAATAVTVSATAIPTPPTSFVVDRPFLYLIRDIPTGTILFIGRCVDPR